MGTGLRLSILIASILGVYGVLIFNLYQLQIIKGQIYRALAESQLKLAGFLEPHRGNIYFTEKDGGLIPAAVNVSRPVVFAVPKDISDPLVTVEKLAQIFALPEEKLKEILKKSSDSYKLIASEPSAETVAILKDLKLKGIYFDEKEDRLYPLKDPGSHLLGYIGPGEIGERPKGLYGVEFYKETELAGSPGEARGDTVVRPVQGSNLTLTIDYNIQSQAHEILADLIQKHSAFGGTVIVEEPQTGKILAMESQPGFDPNHYSEFGVERFLNPAVQAIYEPGSIFKIITLAAALDAGKITPESKFFDPGWLTLDGKTIKNWDLLAHGEIAPANILEKSINIGAALVEQKLGHDNFYRYLVKFGFDEVSGIDLPGELTGNLKNITSGSRAINFATASFGQGISVTPIALINAVSAIANGGTLLRPQIFSDGPREEIRRVISGEAAEEVTAMMASALEKAEIGRIPKYKLAGKTGTAQVADLKFGGYTGEVINTYAGFGPVSKPRFVILIKLDKPAGAPLAGQTVVPAFRELAQFILNYYNIPPDDL